MLSITSVFVCLLLLIAGTAWAENENTLSSDLPPQAAAANYTVRTFSSRFNTGEVDITGSSKSGFKWYPWKFFGGAAKLDRIVVNTDKSVTLLGDTTGPGGQLATVSPAETSPGFVGIAFGGGGY